MRRFALLIFVGLMTFSASGLLDLAVPEPCPPGESSTRGDADCAATCVRCSCCAQAIEILTVGADSRSIGFVENAVSLGEFTLQGDPSEVLHVPRRFLL